MARKFAHWTAVPTSAWKWPNFSPQEIACRGTGEIMIDEGALEKLQQLRLRLGKPLIVNSAYRSVSHNRRVGGATNSVHLTGRAFDIRMDNHDPARFEREARAVGFTGFGYYPAQGFMHIDTGTPRVWGTPFPKSESTPSFQPEPKPETVVQALVKPEVLTSAGGLLGGAAAVAQGDGPIQYALAGGLALAFVAVALIVVTRVLSKRRLD